DSTLFHRALCWNRSSTKSPSSSRFTRASTLRLNCAVTPSPSSYAAMRAPRSFFMSTPMMAQPSAPACRRSRCRKAATSAAFRLPTVDPGKKAKRRPPGIPQGNATAAAKAGDGLVQEVTRDVDRNIETGLPQGIYQDLGRDSSSGAILQDDRLFATEICNL